MLLILIPFLRTQYQHLAEAFREGYPYLGLEVPKGVTELEDPYDGSMRDQVLEEGEWVLHDVGYYAGHYYVYFGVGPVIVFFLPYLLITGNQLPTYIAMYLTALIAVLAIMGLLSQLIKKWFTQTPFLLYLMFSCLFINGSGLLFAMQRPDFYSLPIIMALAASVSGLYFWFASVEHGFITKWKMIMGSLCMAFVAACRPQFLLGSFFAIIIFWKTTVKNRELFSKKGLLNTISFLLPYAGGVMYYNYIRFGSVFDFGANYNLTYNNMPLRGWRLDRLIYAIVGFGFYPMSVTNTFPFLGQCHYSTAYQGLYVDESLMGGAVANNLYLISTLFIFRLLNL